MMLPLEPGQPEPSATPEKQMVARLCSPLEFVELQDLYRVISDGYHPPLRYYWDARHPAVDFAYYHWKGGGPIAGTGVRSVMAGKVAVALADTFPFGSVVIVETPGEILSEDLKTEFGVEAGKSLYSLYAHMDENSPVVTLGQMVSACETVGFVGKTGNSNASHLHFETRVGPAGTQFTEFSYYREGDSEEARANYRLWATSGKYSHFDPMKLLLYTFGEEETPAPAP
jgi:murein DD-endopeptidase MepM/ murein hydrolase activator NlpD